MRILRNESKLLLADANSLLTPLSFTSLVECVATSSLMFSATNGLKLTPIRAAEPCKTSKFQAVKPQQ